MKNINRKCGICGLHTCNEDYFICYTCINGDKKKKIYKKEIWQAPSSMSFIESKFFENIDSLSEDKKTELLNLLSNK